MRGEASAPLVPGVGEPGGDAGGASSRWGCRMTWSRSASRSLLSATTPGMPMVYLRRLAGLLLRGIAVLLVGAFGVGYAAPFLPPTLFWWTDLFAVLLPLLAGAVSGLSVVLLGQGVRRGAWGRVGLGVVLLGLVAVRFAPRGGTAPAPAEEERLHLMTFNVPMSYARQRPSAQALSDLVHQQGPDLLALQESWVPSPSLSETDEGGPLWPPGPLLEAHGYAPPQVRPSEATLCQPVLGRIPLDSVQRVPLPPARNRCSHYTRTRFRWRGRTAILYNVHLHSVGTVRPWTADSRWEALGQWRAFLAAYRRGALARARQARHLRARIAAEKHPVLLVGDFNSTPHQWAYRHLAEGLQGAPHQALWDWGATFPARWPVVQIDHVLADTAWRMGRARIPAPPPTPPLSDHRPVLVPLQWAEDHSE